MPRLRTALLPTVLAAVAAVTAAEAAWIHQTNSVLQAQRPEQRHPLNLEQTIVNPSDAAGSAVCLAYATTSNQVDKGKIRAVVRITNVDGKVKKRLRFNPRVRRGVALSCKGGVRLAAGDLLEFFYNFRKMPRLRVIDGTPGAVSISAIVSTDGAPRIGDGPLALEPPSGAEAPRGLIPGGNGGWFNSTNSIYHSGSDGTRHPTLATHLMQIPRDTETRPLVCSAYNRPEGDAASQGEVHTVARVAYPNGKTEKFELTGAVVDGVFTACERASRKLRRGTLVAFEHGLAGMGRLDQGHYGDLVSAVSTTGEPAFREEPVVEAPPEEVPPSSEEPGSPSTPAGVFTADDHYAITEVLSVPNFQLRRQTKDLPAKYVIVGPGSIPDPDQYGYNLDHTTGNGATPGQARADWVRKHGPIRGRARLMTDSERRAMEHFDRINSAGGPTGFRVDRAGKLHGDVYRRSFGVQQGGPFNTIEQTVEFFKSLGL